MLQGEKKSMLFKFYNLPQPRHNRTELPVQCVASSPKEINPVLKKKLKSKNLPQTAGMIESAGKV